MLILFDQATPVPIRPFLKSHTVKTASQQGWDRLKNGELLRVAEEAGFDLLLTTDKNIAYQQNLKTRTIAILVLSNPQWPAVRPHVERVTAAVEAVTPGSYAVIEIPDTK